VSSSSEERRHGQLQGAGSWKQKSGDSDLIEISKKIKKEAANDLEKLAKELVPVAFAACCNFPISYKCNIFIGAAPQIR